MSTLNYFSATLLLVAAVAVGAAGADELTILGKFPASGSVPNNFQGLDAAEGKVVAVTYGLFNGNGAVRLIGGSEPPEQLLASAEVNGARKVELGNGRAHVLYSYSAAGNWRWGLRIFSLTDLGEFDTDNRIRAIGDRARGLDLVGQTAYVSWDGGLTIIDVSDPDVDPGVPGSGPQVIGSIGGVTEGFDVEVVGNFAYVADGLVGEVNEVPVGGLRWFDISNPATPVLAGSWRPGAGEVVRGVRVVEQGGTRRAYLVGTKFWIIDLTGPVDPDAAPLAALPEDAERVDVAGDFAFVAGDFGMRVYSVGDPATAKLEVAFNSQAQAEDVRVVGDLAYLADRGGFYALRHGPPQVASVQVALKALDEAGIDNLDEAPSEAEVTPLRPVTDEATLGSQPGVTRGLVADGVTPLVIEVSAQGLQAATDLEVWVDAVEGDIIGGIEARVRVLQDGAWTSLSQVGHRVTLAAPQDKIYLCVDAIGGWELVPPEPSPLRSETQAERVRCLLRLIAPELPGGEVGKEFAVHRPPLAVLAALGYDQILPQLPFWSDQTLERFEEIYGSGFVRPLLVNGVTFELYEWLEELRPEWAVTRADCVADLPTIPWLLETCLTEESEPILQGWWSRPPYRNALNHDRGWYQNIVTINGNHRGSLLYTYLKALQDRSAELAETSGTFNHIPQLTRVFNPFANAVHNLASNVLFSPLSELYTDWIPDAQFDPTAKFHHLSTKLNPELALAYHFVGLSGVRLVFVAPEGSDGVLDFDSSRAGPNRAHSVIFGNISTLPGRVWGADGYLYDDFRVAEEILATLQSEHDNPLRPYRPFSPVSTESLTAPLVPIFGFSAYSIIQSAGSTAATAIAELIAVQPGRGPRGGDIEEIFEIEPAATDPPAGNVNWIVETYGPQGVTSQGVMWEPVPGSPLQIAVTVDPAVIGDTVVFASYPTGSGQIVLARPQLVRRTEPPGASRVGIAISPGDSELALGERADLQVYINYDDGTRLQRWVNAEDVVVTTSDAAVIDVSDEGHWLATGVGIASVTVQAMGFSAVSEMTVSDPNEPQTYSEWRAEQFDADELADPSISGAEVDLEGDGLDLIFEYVSGGRPRFRDEAILRLRPVEVAGETELALVVRFSKSLSGQVTVQRSGDLQSWQDWFAYDPATTDLGAAPVIEVHDAGPWRYLVLWDASIASETHRRHFRLSFD